MCSTIFVPNTASKIAEKKKQLISLGVRRCVGRCFELCSNVYLKNFMNIKTVKPLTLCGVFFYRITKGEIPNW